MNCNETTANDSAITKVFQVTIRNIGFVCAEMETFFNLMGLKFISRKKHKLYEALVGEKISHVLGKVLEENITKTLAFKKSGDGYHQKPMERDFGMG